MAVMVTMAQWDPWERLEVSPPANTQGLSHVGQMAATGRIIVGAKEAIVGWVAKAAGMRGNPEALAAIPHR